MAFIGRHLIPERKAENNLTKEYNLENYLTEVIIPDASLLVGLSLDNPKTASILGLTILRINRMVDEETISLIPTSDTILQAEDRLIIEGDVMELLRDKETSPIEIYAERKFTSDESLTGKDVLLAEAAVAPNSLLIGRTISDVSIRNQFGVLVLAIRRRGKVLRERFIDVPLEVGDVLLIQGTSNALNEVAKSHEFLVTSKLEHETRQTKKAPVALAIMGFAIISAATGLLHISVAGMLGVLLMVLTGCVRPQDMYYEVEWRVIFLIACMMPLGIAMDDKHTGTARWLADWIVVFAGDYGPYVLLACLILFTTLITEVMSNAAAAVLLAPIGIAIAVGMGYQPYPFLMGIAIGASTTFLSPIGHQANVLVYGVGNYKFTDFPRVGALLNLIIFIAALFLIPIFWNFTPL